MKLSEKLTSPLIKDQNPEVTQTHKDIIMRLLRTLPVMDTKLFEQSVAMKIMSSFFSSFIISNNIVVMIGLF